MSQQQITRETAIPQPELTIEDALTQMRAAFPESSVLIEAGRWWYRVDDTPAPTRYRIFIAGPHCREFEGSNLAEVIQQALLMAENQVLELV